MAEVNHFKYWGDDPIQLTQVLTRINSTNVGLSSDGGAGESEIAGYIAAWLQYHGIEHSWIEKISGRPSVIGMFAVQLVGDHLC